MIPSPHRAKGGAPLLGARRVGAPGPFGVRPAEDAEPELDDVEPELDVDLDVDDGQGDEPAPEPVSHVEQQVQRRITAARVRIQAAKERRESFAAARKAGLRHRHAAKLRNLADAEQRRLEAQQQGD